MTIHFQKIPDSQFNIEEDFLVKTSRKIKLLYGLFLLVIALAIASISMWIAIFFAIPVILYLIKSTRKVVIMKINKYGFYYFGRLIFSWNNFKDVEFIDEVPLPGYYSSGINDQFSLMIRYYKDGEPGFYGRKIPLTNTQDKSEEEIMAAIGFYSKNMVTIA